MSELRQARDALYEADRAWGRDEDADQIEHEAYIAQQRVSIAVETASGRRAELQLANLAETQNKGVSVPMPGSAAPDTVVAGELERLGAKSTDRGSVISVGGLSFDRHRVRLNAGGLHRVDSLVDFLNRYPRRRLRIEGYSDNQGSAAMNNALSLQRAAVVRTALLKRGVAAERVDARGYGEVAPVSGSGAVAGHRLDRRVEIVLSDDAGDLRAR